MVYLIPLNHTPKDKEPTIPANVRFFSIWWKLVSTEIELPLSPSQNPHFSQKMREMGHPASYYLPRNRRCSHWYSRN